MKKTAILLTALIMSTVPAISQCQGNNMRDLLNEHIRTSQEQAERLHATRTGVAMPTTMQDIKNDPKDLIKDSECFGKRVEQDQDTCVELDANMWVKQSISFNGKEASIEELIKNNPTFNPELWYENFGMEDLGTIGSPKHTSFFNDIARFHTLAKQQPGGTKVIWLEKLNALILPEGWKSGYASETCNNLAAHKAMIAEFNKKYDAIEQEMQKTLQ